MKVIDLIVAVIRDHELIKVSLGLFILLSLAIKIKNKLANKYNKPTHKTTLTHNKQATPCIEQKTCNKALKNKYNLAIKTLLIMLILYLIPNKYIIKLLKNIKLIIFAYAYYLINIKLEKRFNIKRPKSYIYTSIIFITIYISKNILEPLSQYIEDLQKDCEEYTFFEQDSLLDKIECYLE